MIRLFPNEIFKDLNLDSRLSKKYAISNFGRLISYTTTFSEGDELKGSMAEGFRIFRVKDFDSEKRREIGFQFSRLVAKNFIPNDDEVNKKFVIHLDHNKLNDRVENLRWATQKEVTEHNKKNPLVITGRAKTIEHNIKADGRKLTSTQVIRIKKMLQRLENEEDKTRLTMIAKQFNITTQQLRRIKSGENWSHIKI